MEERTQKKKVTLTLPPDLFQRAKLQAVKEGRPLSDMAQEIFEQYLSNVEKPG